MEIMIMREQVEILTLGWKQICKAHKCINESPKNWKIERKSKRIIVVSVYSLNYGHSALYSLCVELNQN